MSRIPGSLPRDVFEKNLGSHAGKTVVVYCTIGYRSGLYAKELNDKGLKAVNLKGGILSWIHASQRLNDDRGETRRVHVYGAKWDLAPQEYETTY